jgi:hypothetical protein
MKLMKATFLLNQGWLPSTTVPAATGNEAPQGSGGGRRHDIGVP